MKKPLSQPSALEDAALAQQRLVVIDDLGAHGDGVARLEGRVVHVPFALPGEKAWMRQEGGQRAKLLRIEQPSQVRADPICVHFGACGGCALQHLNDDATADWKKRLIAAALDREGIAFEPAQITSYPTASRRRVTFSAVSEKGRFICGFKGARSHDIVDIEACPILAPEISAVLPALRAGLKAALSGKTEARVHLTAAENGLDIGIEGVELKPEVEKALLSRLADARPLRVIWNGKTVQVLGQPAVVFDGAQVVLPPGAFLQAVAACERDMAGFILESLKRTGAVKGPVCDLFAGLGAFTFPLARLTAVTAVEMAAPAVEALGAAARLNQGFKPIQALRRDLYRSPLSPLELNCFSAAVLDPPREGAEAQARSLAASAVQTVAMLSCNPATFARDAAVLVAGGYRLTSLMAFDQFKFSAHVELAALFQKESVGRDKRKKGRTVVRPL